MRPDRDDALRKLFDDLEDWDSVPLSLPRSTRLLFWLTLLSAVLGGLAALLWEVTSR